MDQTYSSSRAPRVAIIGMAIRCPGAKNVGEFWANLKNGVESISFFSADELREAGISEAVLQLPSFIRAGAPLAGLDLFDAEFFNYSAREAEFIDPQQRVFLECAVEALESAGVDPARHGGAIGVFAGEGQMQYGVQILANRSVIGVDRQMAVIGNDKDYLATRTSYKLGLRGPSITVQCACSTSTVAVHLAIQSLLSRESDLALAGGVSVSWLRGKGGYHFVEGGILSRDGHTRAFDANASGTVFADGVAIVVLKRLEEAIADGDDIQAVILGTAVNNDGANKISYTAPSIEGQCAVLSEAMAVAGISPETIGYVEAHGTGTALGDPIEIEALRRVFRTGTDKKQFCGVGSLKTNMGHLNTISGLAGMIKAALCVKTGEIPPSLHFATPNPKIDFANSPFYIPTRLTRWPASRPRRACISAFGIGGTNTEVIVEEPPPVVCKPSGKGLHVAIVSAKSESALEAAASRLAQHLREHPQDDIADVCHTLAAGRALYGHARAVICRSPQEAAEALAGNDPNLAVSCLRAVPGPPVTFLFPGQGSQHLYMGRELYKEEPVFRRELDRCAAFLLRERRIDLRAMLFPKDAEAAEAERLLRNTRYTQPAIFSVSYALAKLWMSIGVRPAMALGHSIGEFVAACLAEVFSLEEALCAVAERGRLIQELPGGAMLAVMRPAAEVEALLPRSIGIAAINTPAACVASGPREDIAALERLLAEKGISSSPLHTSHAFHSAMMEPAVGPFMEFMRDITLKAPQLPYISNVTGEWITDEQATNPSYWGAHMRAPVLFHKGLTCIREQASTAFVEVGPGRSLATLARSFGNGDAKGVIISSMAHAAARGAGELKAFLGAAAELWVQGVPIDWSRRYEGERRRKRPLPTYPFERKRYWVLDEEQAASGQPGGLGRPEPAREQRGSAAVPAGAPARAAAPYSVETATWKRLQYSAQAAPARVQPRLVWLLFVEAEAADRSLAEALASRGGKVVVVEKAQEFRQLGEDRFSCDPHCEADVEALCASLAQGLTAEHELRAIYFCKPSRPRSAGRLAAEYREEVDDKINAPIALIRALTRHAKAEKIGLTLVTREGQEITGEEAVDPMMALPIGPCLAGMHEYPGLSCRIVDIPVKAPLPAALVQQLAADLAEPRQSTVTAYRGNARWARTVDPIPAFLLKNPQAALRNNGVYLITGGLGALGLALSRHLAENFKARLILVSRTALPPREQWNALQAAAPAVPEEERLVRLIRGMEQIEAAGGTVMTAAADVCDLPLMQAVLSEAIGKFGGIDGVIHAAGVPGNTPIGLKTADEVNAVLKPKIVGLAVLEQIFASRRLDFMALFSSTSALWGRIGQVDYSAANAYLDAYAIARFGRAPWPIVSINWDNWREVGMAVDTLRAAPGETKPRQLQIGLSTAAGVRAFSQALVAQTPQVIVRALRPQPAQGQSRPAADGMARPQPRQKAKPKAYPRPALAQPYRAAATELEMSLAAMWTELLMVTPIGLDDNFFELGGHSLLALQLLPKMRDTYQISLEPRELFGNATIAKLAAHIQDKLSAAIPTLAAKTDPQEEQQRRPADAETIPAK